MMYHSRVAELIDIHMSTVDIVNNFDKTGGASGGQRHFPPLYEFAA